MKLAIMQPYFFPYIGYFQLIAAVDKFIIYDDVNYINRGWINRNNILINGKAGLVSVPLIGSSQNKLIKDLDVVFEEKWKNLLLKTICQNYKKAPFFEIVFPMLNMIILSKASSISKYNLLGLTTICKYLKISTNFIHSSDVYKNSELKGQNRIIDICKKEYVRQYINPIGGIGLYDKNEFAIQGLKLNFLKTKKVEYKQFHNEFVPWLSILDVLMFNSVVEVNEMLNQYELI